MKMSVWRASFSTVFACTVAAATVRGEEIRRSFLNSQPISPVFSLSEPWVKDYVRQTPEGFLISLPASDKPLPAAGVITPFRVQGDFEITTTYEIVQLEPPVDGWGAGLELVVMADSRRGDGATAARFYMTNEKHVFATDHMTFPDGKDRHQVETTPAKAMKGKLRLARVGDMLHYLVAEGDENELREIRREAFVDDDLTWVRIAAQLGGARTPLSIRLIDVSICADSLPLSDGSQTDSKTWILWSLFSGAAVAIVSFVVAIRLRKPPVASPN